MNSFGRKFRVSIYGESHGTAIGILIDGVPPGIKIDFDELLNHIFRRKPKDFAGTPRKEKDLPEIISGVFRNKTSGAPINLMFKNQNVRSEDYDNIQLKPRPGHSDFAAHMKYKRNNDIRGGGHFSGRLTLGLVAAGWFAKEILKDVDIFAGIINEDKTNDRIEIAKKNNDSTGAVIECKVSNLPAGIGEPFFDSVESCISHMIFSIPGIKGIEFGAGFKAAEMFGSQMNDEIIEINGKTKTNNAGGINGGISNGNEIIFRVAVKPTSSIGMKQNTINFSTGEKTELEIKGRHDVCFALRTPVIIESATAIALADLFLLNT
jgi:chorismate synthase